MKLRFGAMLLMMFFVHIVLGQTQVIDSLNNKLEKALTQSERLATLISLGLEQSELESTLRSGRQNLQKAIDLAEQLGDIPSVILIYESVAEIEEIRENNSVALDTLYSAINIAKVNDLPVEVAYLKTNIADVLTKLNRDNEAVELYHESIEEHTNLKETEGYVFALNNLGVHYLNNEKYLQAIECFNKVIATTKLNDVYYNLGFYLNLGQAYAGLERYDEAYVSLEKAFNYYDEITENNSIHTMLLLGVASIFIEKEQLTAQQSARLNEFGGMVSLFEVIASKIEHTGNIADLIDLNTYKSEYFSKIGEYKQAYIHEQEARKLEEKRFDELQLKTYANLELTYQTNKKEQQIKEQQDHLNRKEIAQKRLYYVLIVLIIVILIAILIIRRIDKDKRIINNQKERLGVILKDKEVLLKEVNHRVKNNLQIVTSMLDKQARKSDNKAVKQVLEEGKRRISTIALVHQRLCQSEQLERVNVKSFVEELSLNIADFYNDKEKNIVLNVQVSDIFLDIDTTVPLGLILNELLVNCYKHAFNNKSEGEIKVSLILDSEDRYLLCVQDNGVGFEDHLERGENSIGLDLIKGLTWQLNGEFYINVLNEGSEFTISFKP